MEIRNDWRKKTALRCHVPLTLSWVEVSVGAAPTGRVMVTSPYSEVSALRPHKCGIAYGWSSAGGSTYSLRPLGDGNAKGSRRGGGSATASMFAVIDAGSLHGFIGGSGRGKRGPVRDLSVRMDIGGSRLLLRCQRRFRFAAVILVPPTLVEFGTRLFMVLTVAMVLVTTAPSALRACPA